MIGRRGERGSGISVLAARHGDDDDFNFCCSCSLEPEIIKIGQSSHKMYIWKLIEGTTYINIINVFLTGTVKLH